MHTLADLKTVGVGETCLSYARQETQWEMGLRLGVAHRMQAMMACCCGDHARCGGL